MSRSLGVADSKADIDDGIVQGLSKLGTATSSTIGFYGKTPIAQRAYTSAVHASSALASSADFGVTQLAVVNEIQATLVALGIWATA